MTPTSSFYSVVVLGGMNPRIHSPGWYRLVDLISDEEHAKAVESSSFSIPPLARVQLPGLEIQCQENRWEALTHDPSQSDRLADIAGRIFDELLKHTAVAAYGFNFHFTYKVESDAGRILLKALKGTGLTSGVTDAVTGQFAIVRDRGVFTNRVEVQPSGDNAIIIASNYHHQIQIDPARQKPGFFDIGADLKRYLTEHREEALQGSMDYATHLGLQK